MAHNCFKGKLVMLRAQRPEDVEILKKMDLDRNTDSDRCDDCIKLPRPAWKLEEGFKERLERESEPENYRFMIDTLDGVTVGSINAHDVDFRMGTFSYGLGVYEEYRHHGYASEAVILMMRYYFNELRMHKCNVAVYEFNEASIGLHEHLGFVREGVVRETYYTDGRYCDDILFGMTRDEFTERYGQIL
ncbi:MAG: GNAT family N-acetyltransferase [Lachnospiraceae bacterium]|nr:GNAT family N-acetyltransferase [Lachnospiraceae bacterium]